MSTPHAAARPRRLRGPGALAASALAVVVLAASGLVSLVVTAPPAAAATVHDGASQTSAAASCWEVKQEVPSAGDGVYWIVTPQLPAPVQVYCDMTTDGGGWALVGRGRDNWTWDGDAQGTPAQVASTVTGPEAFEPRKLSTATIDGLLGGRRVDQLADGVRLRRATDVDGTSWQEVRFRIRSLVSWSWAFGAGHPLTSATIDGVSYSGATTMDFGPRSTGASTRFGRVWTYEDQQNAYVRGFNYSSAITGTTSSTSHLYSRVGNYATPFTQVFIRPTLRTADLTYSAIPDTGTAATTALPVARSGSLYQPWGVTGTGAGGTSELATEVQAFAQVGDVMYVGGNFTSVRNQTGSVSVSQPYLAAFDATTGEWISSFRPAINHQVRSLAALPDGRLAVGGDFTSVDGTPRSGLAVFDPSTGQVDTTWTTGVENRVTGARHSVRALKVSGGWLYLGGAFTHTVQGSSAWFERNAARISLSTGRGDSAWNPNLNGSVADLDVDDDGTRVYVAGYMTLSGTTEVKKGAAFSTASGAAVVPWNVVYSATNSTYQQAVQQVGDKVWLGGSQHSMYGYDRATLQIEDQHITRAGGDLQAIADNGSVVYGGCHCGDWSFTDATDYLGLQVGSEVVQWSQAGKISLLGAWDATTGEFITTFAPQWKSRGGYGVWSVDVADDGTVWAGGSLETSVKENGANQFSGGFARFAPRPSTAPEPPSAATATIDGTSADVSWTASPTSDVTYEVLRNDRVVATTTSTSISFSDATSTDRYFVRATDGQDNRSASTPLAQTTVVPQTTAIVPAGGTWTYLADERKALGSRWALPGFTVPVTWTSGAGPVGWGDASIVTDARVAGAQPQITTYLRQTFTLGTPKDYASYRLTARADDGLVLYVNGTEVARSNLPTGPVARTTPATAAPSTSAAVATPLVVDIPRSLLLKGRNVIAAEVHAADRATADLSFDAVLEGTR